MQSKSVKCKLYRTVKAIMRAYFKLEISLMLHIRWLRSQKMCVFVGSIDKLDHALGHGLEA